MSKKSICIPEAIHIVRGNEEIQKEKRCCCNLKKDANKCACCIVSTWSCILNSIECLCGACSTTCFFCGTTCKKCNECLETIDCDGK